VKIPFRRVRKLGETGHSKREAAGHVEINGGLPLSVGLALEIGQTNLTLNLALILDRR